MARPLVTVTLLFISGITTAYLFPMPLWLPVTLVLATFVAAGAGFAADWRYNHYLLMPFIISAGLLITSITMDLNKGTLPEAAGQNLELKGMVADEPVSRGSQAQYIIDVESCYLKGAEKPARGKILLAVKSERLKYSYGDTLKFSGTIQNPVTAGNPGEFDYSRYLKEQGIAATIRVWDENGIEVLRTRAGNPLVRLALEAKRIFIAVTDKTMPASDAAIVKGIIFGVTDEIDKKTLDIFRQTGVVHVLSVSGLHVALVLGVILGLGRAARLPARLNYILATVILIFYALMTGLGPAVQRSVLMGLVIIIGELFRRERDWPSSLAFSALVIMALNPMALFNTGFQLSYTATWAILNITPWINKRLQFLPAATRNVITVPLAAQLGTWPIVAYYFNFLSPVSLLANVVAVPLTGVVLILGLAATMTGLFYIPLARFINYSTTALTELFASLVRLFSYLPGSVFYLRTPPLWFIFLWYTLLLVLVNPKIFEKPLIRFRRLFQVNKTKFLIAGLLVISILVWSSAFGAQGGDLKVTFIDVGEGDCILIQTPAGNNMLIDAGPASPTFDAGEKKVVPYLRRTGIDKIDAMVLTHPHEDHIGGAGAILSALPVKMLILPAGAQSSEPLQAIKKKAASERAALEEAMAGNHLQLDKETQINFLFPETGLKGTYSDLNNNSLVLKLDYGKYSFLFTGDIEAEAITALMSSGSSVKSTVLKLPHHGSRNSLNPEFYSKVSPGYAVITVGPNRFGHPAGEVISELTRQGVKVYRTDNNGAITFTCDGRRLAVDTFRKGEPNGIPGTNKQY